MGRDRKGSGILGEDNVQLVNIVEKFLSTVLTAL
jgi:hypothetical protein